MSITRHGGQAEALHPVLHPLCGAALVRTLLMGTWALARSLSVNTHAAALTPMPPKWFTKTRMTALRFALMASSASLRRTAPVSAYGV